MIDQFVSYWQSHGLGTFVRIFWFFVFFEFTRYVLFDYVIVLVFAIKRKVRERHWELARHSLLTEMPIVSVIVPGRNEGAHIFKLVRSLAEQSYTNLEIIVVDDGSDDQTPVIGRSLQKAGLITSFVRNEERGGKASAANLALRLSKGRFIVHLDADSSFHHNAIENALVPFYLDEKIGGVGGSLEVRDSDKNLCTTLQAIEYLKTITMGRIVTSTLGIYPIISGAFGVFRKDVMDKIKGWDIGPGLDGDLTVKIRKAGFKVHFEPSSVGLTSVPPDFIKLAAQRLRWSKSVIRFRIRKHGSVFYPDEHFSFMNLLASTESILYGVIFNVLWYINLFDQIIHYPTQLQYILPMSFLLYVIANFFQFFLILAISHEDFFKRLKFLPYLPLIVIYNGLYLRVVRTIAHISEVFFFTSYKDPWNPAKTSRHARTMRI